MMFPAGYARGLKVGEQLEMPCFCAATCRPVPGRVRVVPSPRQGLRSGGAWQLPEARTGMIGQIKVSALQGNPRLE
jgi:hypothetical protein